MSKDENHELREKMKTVTAKDVAEKTGLHYQSVYNFRVGKTVSPRTLSKIQRYARDWIEN